MPELNLNKVIQVAKDTKAILKPDCGMLKMEYFIYHEGRNKTLIIDVDCKAAYLTFDGARISKPKLQKILNEIKEWL